MSDNAQAVERYLARELSDEEAERFEERLLWDAALQEELAMAEALRRGLHDVAAAQPAAQESAPPEPAGQEPGPAAPPSAPPPAGRSRALLSSPAYSIAATVLLLVGAAGWLGTLAELRSLRSGAAVASAYVVPLETTRGAPGSDPLSVVRRVEGAEWLTLLVYADLAAHDVFAVTVERRAGAGWVEVWQRGGLVRGGGDALAVTLRGETLVPGEHRVRVAGRGKDWPADRAAVSAGTLHFRVE